MKKIYLIFIIFILFDYHFASSSIEKQANELIQKIKDAGKTQDVGIFIIKNGESKAIQECVRKNYGTEAVCKKVVEIAIKELKSQSNKLIEQIKSDGKWPTVIDYVKNNGIDKAADKCYKKGYGYKAVCYLVSVIANKENSSPFNKEEKSDNSIYLIPKSGKYKYILIFIHGLFGSPKNIVDKFDKLNGPIPDTFKIILPCAPLQKSYPAGGKKERSWFDIHRNLGNKSPIKDEEINFKEFDTSSKKIKTLIDKEVKNVDGDYSKIIVAGYSQGACLTYDIGLSFDHLLGGISCFCGIPFDHTEILENNKKNLNIFAALGSSDPYFPLNQSKNTINKKIGNNKNLKIQEYKGKGHELTDEALRDMGKFILNKIK